MSEFTKTFKDLQHLLPRRGSSDYESKRHFIDHILTNNMALFPDFGCSLGRYLHYIDIRPESEFRTGYIPGCNWFPQADGDVQSLLDHIEKNFDKNLMIAIVCANGVKSRQIAMQLREQRGFGLVSVLAGGIRLYRIFGFTLSHQVQQVLDMPYQPRSVMRFHDLVTDDLVLTRAANLVHQEHLKKLQYDDQIQQFDFALNQSIIAEQVSKHVSSELQWCKVSALTLHAKISCIDGRGESGVVSSPGGDFGVFLLILSTYEYLSGCALSYKQLQTLFAKRLDTFGRFYLHTGEAETKNCLNMIQQQLPQEVWDGIVNEMTDDVYSYHGFRSFVSKVPPQYHDLVTNILISPSCVGCGHIKLIMLHSHQYSVRRQLVEDVFRIFFQHTFWSIDADNTDCDYVVLPGSHQESGILSVELNTKVHPYSKIPLVSPSVVTHNGCKQMFVNFPSVVAYLRGLQCDWLLETIDNSNREATITKQPLPFKALSNTARNAFHSLVELHAEKHATFTCGYLAKGLPVYSLVFDVEHAHCNVTLQGFIEREEDQLEQLQQQQQLQQQNQTPASPTPTTNVAQRPTSTSCCAVSHTIAQDVAQPSIADLTIQRADSAIIGDVQQKNSNDNNTSQDYNITLSTAALVRVTSGVQSLSGMSSGVLDTTLINHADHPATTADAEELKQTFFELHQVFDQLQQQAPHQLPKEEQGVAHCTIDLQEAAPNEFAHCILEPPSAQKNLTLGLLEVDVLDTTEVPYHPEDDVVIPPTSPVE